MKRIISLILISVMILSSVLSLTSCDDGGYPSVEDEYDEAGRQITMANPYDDSIYYTFEYDDDGYCAKMCTYAFVLIDEGIEAENSAISSIGFVMYALQSLTSGSSYEAVLTEYEVYEYDGYTIVSADVYNGDDVHKSHVTYDEEGRTARIDYISATGTYDIYIYDEDGSGSYNIEKYENGVLVDTESYWSMSGGYYAVYGGGNSGSENNASGGSMVIFGGSETDEDGNNIMYVYDDDGEVLYYYIISSYEDEDGGISTSMKKFYPDGTPYEDDDEYSFTYGE